MDWKDIVGPVLQQTAPAAARILLGQIPIVGPIIGELAGKAAEQAIGELLGEKFGVPPTPEAVGKAIQDMPSDVVVAKLQAAEAEAQARWPALVEMAKAAEQGRTDRFRIGTGDNADARTMLDKLVQVRSPIAWAPLVVTVLLIAGFFVVLWIFLNRPPRIDDNYKDVLLVLLGALTTAFIQAVSYWLGSSAGSANKDAAFRDITATSVIAASNSAPMPVAQKVSGKR